MNKVFFLNGKFVPENNAKIEVDNLGLLRGYGVFDYARTYNRIPFCLDKHISRLFRSAKKINLKIPFKPEEIKKIVLRLIKLNKNMGDLGLRIVAAGGKTVDGRTSEKVNFFIIVSSPHRPSEIFYKKGIKLATIDYLRQFPEIKSLNYTLACANWKKITRQGAQEILYLSKGKVFECSTSNFFIVKNKIIKTQKNQILKGVTKEIALNLAKKSGLRVQEKELGLKETLAADEAFITATDKEILPVTKINNHKIGNGKVGEITKKLMEMFKRYVEANSRPKKS